MNPTPPQPPPPPPTPHPTHPAAAAALTLYPHLPSARTVDTTICSPTNQSNVIQYLIGLNRDENRRIHCFLTALRLSRRGNHKLFPNILCRLISRILHNRSLGVGAGCGGVCVWGGVIAALSKSICPTFQTHSSPHGGSPVICNVK